MASGIPGIVSDKVGCAPDLVIPEVTGDVFPCGEVQALAEIFIKWSKDRNEIRRLGKNAKERIAAYSLQNAVDGTMAALQSVSNS
jgi:glycosyltransferase involved in cell wall biosynthesis